MKTLGIGIGLMVILYLLFAFVLGVINPMLWHAGARYFLVVLSIFLTAAYKINNEINN
jgi:hypothetical protein